MAKRTTNRTAALERKISQYVTRVRTLDKARREAQAAPQNDTETQQTARELFALSIARLRLDLNKEGVSDEELAAYVGRFAPSE